MTECEADERNRRALFILENNWGCGRIDVGALQRILRGEACTHQPETADKTKSPKTR